MKEDTREPVQDVFASQRTRVFTILCVAAGATGLFFGIWDSLGGYGPLGVATMVVGVLCLSNLALLKLHKNEDAAYFALWALSFALQIFLLVGGGVGGSGHLWYFLHPLFTLFLLGARRGIILLGILFASVVVLFYVPFLSRLTFYYSDPFKLRFLISLTLVSAATYYYERLRQNSHQRLKDEASGRRLFLEQLIKEKARAESFRRIVPCAVFTVSTGRIVTSFSAWAEEITGYAAADVLGQECFLWAIEPCRVQCGVFNPDTAKPIRDMKCRIRRKDGEIRTVLKNADVVVDGEGRVTGAIESFVDITDQEELADNLRRASKAAEDANAAKSTFMANMSHEIRTPLNGIVGLNNLLAETGMTSEQREYVEGVASSSEVLLNLLNDILDLSKIEAGGLDVETIDFNLRTTIESAMEIVAFRGVDKDLEIASLIKADVPDRLRGDPGRLRQIIVNIGGNAVKFTDKGEVVLTVGLVNETDAGAKVRFEVADTGVGIPLDRMDGLFEPFYQGDPSVTRKYGGTGLGLTIARRLVGLMGGEIGVDSKAGEGTTFWFTVNMVKQKNKGEPDRTGAAELGEKRVLAIDSTAIGNRVLSHYLQAWGCSCTVLDNPQEVLAELKKGADEARPYDAAVVGTGLRGLGGLQVARLVKADPSLRKTKVILVSAVGNRGDATEVRRAGADAYLTKPIKQAELSRCLAMVISGDHPRGEGKQANLVTRYTLEEARRKDQPRVLVAEDNAVNRKVITRNLAKSGYNCDVALNGLEAVEAQSRKHYDLVLMDCQMPVLSGYDATRAIRADESKEGQSRHVPIVAMTANALKGDREKCLRAGMDDYVSKPVDVGELMEKLAHWTQKPKGISGTSAEKDEETDA